MKRLVSILSLAASSVGVAATAQAAAPSLAERCPSGLFQVIAGQLSEFDVGSSTYLPMGADQSNYNAMGLNPADGYLYAIRSDQLLRIDAAGTVVGLGTVGIVPGSYTGDFGDDGRLHVSRGGNDWYAIDVTTLEATRLSGFSQNYGVADIANVSGIFYGVSSSGVLWSFDVTTETATNLGAVAGVTGANKAFGAAWTTAGANLYVGRNSGEIYQITGFSTGDPVATQIATSPSTNSNDGASCPYAPPPAGLPDVDGPTPEVAPSTEDGLAAAAAYELTYEAPQFAAPDAGLGEGAACAATVAEDQLPRDAVSTSQVTSRTVLVDETFDGDATGWSVMSGSWMTENGSYRQLNDCEYDLISLLTTHVVEYFDLEVTFSSPTVPNHGGVVFNVSSTDSRSGAIVVDLADDGATLRWGRYDELGYYENIGWDLVPAPAAGEPVTIRIESRGDQYTIIHQGNTVVTETTTDPGGMVGLISTLSQVDFHDVELAAVPS